VSENEKPQRVIACLTVEELPIPAPISTKERCHWCECEVWLHHSTVAAMNRIEGSMTHVWCACFSCASTLDAEFDGIQPEQVEAIMTPVGHD
jgi:hypothetical protein